MSCEALIFSIGLFNSLYTRNHIRTLVDTGICSDSSWVLVLPLQMYLQYIDMHNYNQYLCNIM